MNFYANEIQKLKEKDNFRRVSDIEAKEGKYIRTAKGLMLNLSSNDYLNLSTDKELVSEFTQNYKSEKEFIFSSTSSRLLTGTSRCYKRLEENLAGMFKKESSLLFNTGYQCNLGVISSLVNRDDVIFSDKLNHASIIDGMRLGGSKFYRYRHLDYEHLEEMLKKYRKDYKKAIMVSESVFSMDGDIGNLKELVRLKKEYDCYLMTDEAHAFGIFGENLTGIAEREELLNEIDIITATLGKSFASMGAFCVADKTITDYLINKANSFIFSTALPSVNVMWTNFLLEEKIAKVKEQSKKLNKLIKYVHEYIKDSGETQILPVIIGKNDDCVKIAEQMQSKGYYVLPVRPPTVPENTSRLRISLTADITNEAIKGLIDKVTEAKNALQMAE